MKRWKLWASIATSVLSLSGGSTYYLWNRQPAANADQIATNSESPSPHSLRPKPIPDVVDAPPATGFVRPASFDAPSSEATNSTNDRTDSFPVRPRAGSVPSTVLAAASETTASISDSPSPYRPRFNGQESEAAPAQLDPAKEAAVDPNSESPPEQPAPILDSPVFDPNAPASAPLGTNSRFQVPTDEAPKNDPALTSEPPAELPPDHDSDVQATPPPRPMAQSPKSDAIPPDVSVEAPVSTGLEKMPSRFGNPRPAAPALKSSLSAPGGPLKDSAPIVTLPDAEVKPTEPVSRRPITARNAAIAPRAATLISNAPGERKLEGLQSPSLTVERNAPEEIQVGKPAKFVIKVKNVGQVAAQEVVVTDQIPQGTRFLSATPETTPTAEGTLAWELGELQPGEDSVLTVELMPELEGEIGSVAEVAFRTPAAVRTIATKPLLKVEHTGPAKVLIGEDVPFQITVSNPGSGIATGVVIEVDVPEGLAHEGGREIMSDRFDLRPNESRKLDLIMRAVQPGSVQSVVRAVGDGTLAAEHRAELDVVAPQLQVGTVGPTRRFLDRPVKYQILVANPGTAPAKQVELVARLPRGLKFVAADKKGQYDQRQHAVLWSLEELPVGEQGTVELTAIPTDTGEQKLHVEGRAALGLEHQHEHTTVVEDITDLVFTVTDENVPIEVGSETTYQIRVANNGTKVATNVRLAVQVPEGMEIIDSDGPTQAEQQGDQLVMQPITELAQNEEAVYRLTAKGTRAGDHVLRVQLVSDEFSTPVTKEEITKVYSDK